MFNAKRLISTLLITYTIVLGVNLAMNYQYYAAGADWRFSVYFCIAISTLGGIGGATILPYFIDKLNWRVRPALKFLYSIAIFALYGALIMVCSMKVMVLLGFSDPTRDSYQENVVYSVLFSMIIGLIVSGRQFLKHLQKSIEDNERMKRAMLQSQYETLKNQVNPHFLFNSLNTLVSLIPSAPDKAVAFVEQMAKVMRYSLIHNEDNVVEVQTELTVVLAYLFLNQQRFEEKLVTEINIEETALTKKIPTHALLMLVENAIKHNEISHDSPLRISIYNEAEMLVVCNNLQRRSVPEPSTGIGLDNIRKRYDLVSDRPVAVEEKDGSFCVRVPLL